MGEIDRIWREKKKKARTKSVPSSVPFVQDKLNRKTACTPASTINKNKISTFPADLKTEEIKEMISSLLIIRANHDKPAGEHNCILRKNLCSSEHFKFNETELKLNTRKKVQK